MHTKPHTKPPLNRSDRFSGGVVWGFVCIPKNCFGIRVRPSAHRVMHTKPHTKPPFWEGGPPPTQLMQLNRQSRPGAPKCAPGAPMCAPGAHTGPKNCSGIPKNCSGIPKNCFGIPENCSVIATGIGTATISLPLSVPIPVPITVTVPITVAIPITPELKKRNTVQNCS